MPMPAPAGVPVAMMSPGSSVMIADALAISVGYVEDHLGRVSLLPQFAVDGQPDAEGVWIGDLVRGDDPRAAWREPVEPLPGEPVEKRIALAQSATLKV